MKVRLDQYLLHQNFARSRSQASNLIGLGKVQLNGAVVTKSGHIVGENDSVLVTSTDRYVSRAAYKLDSVVKQLGISFVDKTVLDVGSSTGGFTDYALQHGAIFVYAVDVGSNQLHTSLRGDSRIELHEKTDIRDFTPTQPPDLILIDVSFIPATKLLPKLTEIASEQTDIIIMAKPQFEARDQSDLHNGIVKNNRIRRDIFRQFEARVANYCKIISSFDSGVAGAKGNVERFYHLHKLIQ
jgi:23S rRNA (cytidine1920-2'-O)/16S rRNA (cytidine1409-2'-O)-methyltransferase